MGKGHASSSDRLNVPSAPPAAIALRAHRFKCPANSNAPHDSNAPSIRFSRAAPSARAALPPSRERAPHPPQLLIVMTY